MPRYNRRMKQPEMNILVPEKLHQIEKEMNVEVLWAVESGSRAWGFASDDSDFDVRFIYKRKASGYLKLNPDRDVIELPVDDIWDVSGWDLDKTLKLLSRSNPTLYEWMNSPIRYIETDFRQRLQPLLDLCFSEKKTLYHYLSTARSNLAHHLTGNPLKPKKYFYILRPLLACRWIMKEHTAPPVLFDELTRKVLPDEMRPVVEELLKLKISTPEKYEILPIKELDEYLHNEIRQINEYLSSLNEPEHPDWDRLNDFFLKETGMV